MIAPPLPRFIALCGHPGSGKSEAQAILHHAFDVAVVDDGLALREFAVANFGLTWDQVSTQEGKASTVDINRRPWQVRDILGQLGNHLEECFGADVIPEITFNRIMAAERRAAETLRQGGMRVHRRPTSYSLGSVRREQGGFWRRKGALVIEIRNPDAQPSRFAFDAFNRAHCHAWIKNDGLARGLTPADARIDLGAKLFEVLSAFADDRRAVA